MVVLTCCGVFITLRRKGVGIRRRLGYDGLHEGHVRIDSNSLKGKILITLLFIFLFLVVVSLLNNLVASMAITRQTMESATASVAQTDGYLSLIFNKAKEVSYVLSMNENLRQLCSETETLLPTPYGRYRLIDALDKDLAYQVEINGEIRSIYLYLNAWGRLITTIYGIYTTEQIRGGVWWFSAVNGGDGSSKWQGYMDDTISRLRQVSFLCRPDRINRDLKSAVYLSVNFEQDALYRILRSLKRTSGTSVFLVDAEGLVQVAEDEEAFGMPLDLLLSGDMAGLKKTGLARMSAGKSGKERVQAIYRENSVTGWGILVLVPERELLGGQRLFLAVSMGILLLLFLALVMFSWRLLVRHVDAPVALLVRHMEAAEKGDFDREIGDTRRDEFGFLFDGYNAMVRQIKLLIRELYQEKLLKREIELKVLQNQINPHFLYNTLDTINWIAKTNGVPEISRIVISLSTLYRASFNKGRDHIEVRDMLRSMESYLFIERFRYKSLSDYCFQVDPRTYDFLVLNLILQPVVENAVVHGIGDGDLGRPGLITVGCSLEGHCIRLEVGDNGRGMEPGKLSLLRESLEDGGMEADSGLRNVAKRIRLFYGEGGLFRVESVPGGGTRVLMDLPVSCPLQLPVLGG